MLQSKVEAQEAERDIYKKELASIEAELTNPKNLQNEAHLNELKRLEKEEVELDKELARIEELEN